MRASDMRSIAVVLLSTSVRYAAKILLADQAISRTLPAGRPAPRRRRAPPPPDGPGTSRPWPSDRRGAGRAPPPDPGLDAQQAAPQAPGRIGRSGPRRRER